MTHHQPYRPPLLPIPADPLRGDPRDPRSPMNPLAGIWDTHRTTYGYREASPYGDGVLFVLEWNCSARSQQTANYSLHTANSTVATPISPAHPILNSSFLILNWSYTFSAKEKDSETGLSYFGSRYYSPDLSVWLSVDPMAGKYPYQSGFVYCGNNPIKVIDPNGEDEWEIDKQGNVKWVRQSETHRLYALDKNNKRTGNYITVNDRSSLDDLTTARKDYNGHYSVCNKEDAFKIFKFGADNCDVEWAVAGYRKAGGGREYVVGTANENPDRLYTGGVYAFHTSANFNKYDLSFEIHSHFGPDATQGASSGYIGSDMGNIRGTYDDYVSKGLPTQMGKGFPRFYVYTANTHTLFNYTPWKSSVFIRNIKTSNDLYRNLSF